jgi:hypothetical protein
MSLTLSMTKRLTRKSGRSLIPVSSPFTPSSYVQVTSVRVVLLICYRIGMTNPPLDHANLHNRMARSVYSITLQPLMYIWTATGFASTCSSGNLCGDMHSRIRAIDPRLRNLVDYIPGFDEKRVRVATMSEQLLYIGQVMGTSIRFTYGKSVARFRGRNQLSVSDANTADRLWGYIVVTVSTGVRWRQLHTSLLDIDDSEQVTIPLSQSRLP